MAPKQVRYYFGRLNVTAPGREKVEILKTALASNVALPFRGQRWGFYEFQEMRVRDELFQTGFLVKYKPEAEEEIAVPERRALEDRSIENRVTAKSRFFLHVASGVIAYHPVSSQIPRHLFPTRFVEVLKHSLENFFVDAEIQAIEEQYKILDELAEFNTVSRLSIYLHPSNPSTRHTWQRIDQRMRNINASAYREKFEGDATKGGLKIIDDQDVRQKIAMAEDGYGKVEVTGMRDGRVRKVTTRDNPMSILAPADDAPPERIFPALSETITSFLERFRQ